MGDYISGSIYFSGLGNGTDFSNIISQLQKIEEIPKNRLELWKADWQLRYDAFNEVCKAMETARDSLTTINTPSKFVKKTTSSTEPTRVSAEVTSEAIDSTHTIDVKQLASNAIWAFNGQYDSKTSVVNNTGSPQKFSYTYKGRTREITIANGTTLESLVNIVNNDSQNLGIRMSLIQSDGKYSFQVQGKESGADATLSINNSGLIGIGTGTSTWTTNEAVNRTAALGTSGRNITFTYTLDSGAAKTVTLDGSKNMDDLVDAINAQEGSTVASITGDNKLQLTGINSGTMKQNPYWQSTDPIADPTAPLGTAASKEILLTISMASGETRNITVDGSKSMNDLVDEINAAYPGSASITSEGKLRLEGANNASLNELGDKYWQGTSTIANPPTPFSGNAGDVITYTYYPSGGASQTITLNGGQNYNDLMAAINSTPGAGTASIVQDANGNDVLKIEGDIANCTLENTTTNTDLGLAGYSTRYAPTNITPAGSETVGQTVELAATVSNSNWSIQQSCNAIFMVDNWPRPVSSSTNNVTDVIPGLTLNLYSEGKAQISIATDKTSVKESIQTFLDAINTVLEKVNDLSTVDEDKKTYTSTSQFTSEKGSVLTGNYGVQLLKSRLQSKTSSSPPGFRNIQGDDLLSGDLVAALSQIGIKTCTEEGNPNYGLFMIAPPSSNPEMQLRDQELFDKAIEKNFDAVVDFFSCDSKGSTNSPDFRYASHIKGTTKGGSYDVSYDVDDNGNIGKVFINGVEAHGDYSSGDLRYTAGSDAGDAGGMAIIIDDLTPGSHKGTISIKQGKIGEMEDFFKAELKVDKFGNNSGSMVILKENYQQIMDNIDVKIEKEEVRLLKWLQTQRLAFSRLETLLGQYDGKQQQLASQLNQLASDT